MQKMSKFSIIEFVVIENESFKVHPPKSKKMLKQYFSWFFESQLAGNSELQSQTSSMERGGATGPPGS